MSNSNSESTKPMPTFNLKDVDKLFALTSHNISPAASSFYAVGASNDSRTALLKALKDNHVKHHWSLNDMGFHNHTSHTLLAVYALGAPAPLIDSTYEREGKRQRPAFESPTVITEGTFCDHLGNEKYYNAYLLFFSELLSRDGVNEGDLLEKYVFSKEYNFGKDGGSGVGKQPRMLNRFFSALAHPMIHVGHGLEFGLKGLVAEGLAQTTVHQDEAKNLMNEAFFDFKEENGLFATSVSHLTNALPALAIQPSVHHSDARPTAAGVGHIFVIMSQMLKDPRLDFATLGLAKESIMTKYYVVLEKCSEIVHEYALKWDLSSIMASSTAQAVDEKIEELYWAHVLIFGIGGWNEETGFKADFFFMHLVTSAIFAPATIASLKNTTSKVTFLRAYCAFALAWWVSQGRQGFSIGKYYETTEAATGSAPNDDLITNPWFSILQTTLALENDHISKLQRSLAHAATVYGHTPRGHFAHLLPLMEKNAGSTRITVGGAALTGFDGLERLDGTVFVRVARLTADRLGWVTDGEEERNWDFL